MRCGKFGSLEKIEEERKEGREGGGFVIFVTLLLSFSKGVWGD